MLTLEIPDEVYRSLIEKAERTGQAPETLAAQLLTTAAGDREEDPVEQFIGAFSSRGSDWADRHDDHLGNSHGT
jgi:hypothetical protein